MPLRGASTQELVSDVQGRAKKRLRAIQRARRDERFLRAVGRLQAAGLLDTKNAGIAPHTDAVEVADMLWAGKVEPRVLELLPAVALKKPSLLRGLATAPPDLKDVLRAIRRGEEHPTFRGVPPEKYLPWVERIGHRGKAPEQLKTLRLSTEDQQRLRRLKERLPARSEAEVIRMALRLLERTQLP